MLINFENFTCQNLVALEKLLNLGYIYYILNIKLNII